MAFSDVELRTIDYLKSIFVGLKVSGIELGYTTSFKFSNSTGAYKIAVTECTLSVDGVSRVIKCSDFNSTFPMTELFNKTVSSFEVSENGCLTIRFESDAIVLSNPSADNFEAWEISSTKELLIVCTLGGSLAIWGVPDKALAGNHKIESFKFDDLTLKESESFVFVFSPKLSLLSRRKLEGKLIGSACGFYFIADNSEELELVISVARELQLDKGNFCFAKIYPKDRSLFLNAFNDSGSYEELLAESIWLTVAFYEPVKGEMILWT